MALSKYNATPPPVANMRTWLYAELRKISTNNNAIVDMLEALDGVKIELGPADSAGVGYRALRIPN